MIDKATIKRRFKRSIDTYDENATVQKMIVNHLFSLVDKYTQQQVGERSVEISIDHPLWASWWAIAIYLILLVILGCFFFQFRTSLIGFF